MGRRNKPKKWSNLEGQLPRDTSAELSERFQQVLAEADKRNGRTMQALQDEWVDLEEEEAFAKLAEYERNVKFEALERRILEELEKVKAVSGGDMWRGAAKTFSPKFTPRPSVEDAAKLMAWIKATGQEHQLTLPAPRLKSIVCEALDTDAAALLTPAERAQLKPGDPASGAPPPGVTVFLDKSVHHTTVKTSSPVPDDDNPF
jgi:hypothetical protein